MPHAMCALGQITQQSCAINRGVISPLTTRDWYLIRPPTEACCIAAISSRGDRTNGFSVFDQQVFTDRHAFQHPGQLSVWRLELAHIFQLVFDSPAALTCAFTCHAKRPFPLRRERRTVQWFAQVAVTLHRHAITPVRDSRL